MGIFDSIIERLRGPALHILEQEDGKKRWVRVVTELSRAFDTAQAIAVMLEKHGIACDMMHGFNWNKWTAGVASWSVGDW